MRQLLSSRQHRNQPPPSDASASDGDLVRASLADPRAFGTLFDRYWDAIFGFCFLRVGDWHEAEDVASEVFVNALDSLNRFKSDEPNYTFRAWLFGIARNLVGTSHRQHQRHGTAPIELAAELPDRSEPPDQLVLIAERQERLLQLLDDLPSDQRELLELRLSGLSAAEIGRVLGRSEVAVRKAQSRTVIALRTALAEPNDALDRQIP